ncbi:MAG: hypothetical protein AMJ54_03410 [Deltaproteobacteria bacterium SG8_13]|nr:MAG: hypothetical protein AMJ54_03410 [Deltaproteobacteria bacterium SG8_13]
MLTAEEKRYVLANAYIPEHSVDLISGISGGEPFLVDDCLVFWKNGELILNGYPLTSTFDLSQFEAMAHRLRRRFRPARISYIAPQWPLPLAAGSGETASDDYYTLALQDVPMSAPVRRNIRNAGRRLTVEKTERMDPCHQQLADEFIARVNPGPRVKRLLDRIPDYVSKPYGGAVLNARDGQRGLNAFYIVDLAPADFSTYIIGCYSRRNYITGASDLLMSALVDLSRQSGKTFIHLGLGINEGLRRFKTKWGGVPARPYRMGTVELKVPTILTGIRDFLKHL